MRSNRPVFENSPREYAADNDSKRTNTLFHEAMRSPHALLALSTVARLIMDREQRVHSSSQQGQGQGQGQGSPPLPVTTEGPGTHFLMSIRTLPGMEKAAATTQPAAKEYAFCRAPLFPAPP